MKLKLAVIGSPIKHSLSPFIHKTALEKAGFFCEYEVCEVTEDNLFEFLNYAKENNFNGFNITMPLKQSIIKYLDEIDGDALLCGAVNTVKIKNGKLFGFNTDGEGYKKSLEDKDFFLKDKNVAFIGAGGSALAVSMKAAKENAAEITVINRSEKRSRELCDFIFEKTGFSAVAETFEAENLKRISKKADLLINATPLGMSGVAADYEDLSFLNYLKKDALVSDFIYNPCETKFLGTAKSLGLKSLNGLGMLIYQGLISDSIYLEKDLDFKNIKNHIETEYKKIIV